MNVRSQRKFGTIYWNSNRLPTDIFQYITSTQY